MEGPFPPGGETAPTQSSYPRRGYCIKGEDSGKEMSAIGAHGDERHRRSWRGSSLRGARLRRAWGSPLRGPLVLPKQGNPPDEVGMSAPCPLRQPPPAIRVGAKTCPPLRLFVAPRCAGGSCLKGQGRPRREVPLLPRGRPKADSVGPPGGKSPSFPEGGRSWSSQSGMGPMGIARRVAQGYGHSPSRSSGLCGSP